MRDNARITIAFYIDRQRKGIALSGYFINALEALNIKKSEIPAWIQDSVNNAKLSTDYGLTRQIHGLILQALVTELHHPAKQAVSIP